MSELLIDPNIRIWVFLPLALITFMVGILRHYVGLCISDLPEVTLDQKKAGQLLRRIDLLKRNAGFITPAGFIARRNHLRRTIAGLDRSETRAVDPRRSSKSGIIDPEIVSELIKSNVTNVMPMVLIGGWINWTFSGFVTAKVPFPLTFRFKSMLQRGIELGNLDASWVSSASWYFFNVFGLRAVFYLFLGENNLADGTIASGFAEELQGSPGIPGILQVPQILPTFKSEYEALGILRHDWSVKTVDTIEAK
ncbi:ER membrane protein complex subunit 3-like [Athalia rosae]|uniref:ER membrane protein complex subunit 3-like n=1 Tax=Athalia rosae TaxID=37344 RepID=UPI002033B92F|nr:ER membrane protein complex subunit 3-like [Athalia rosae]